MHKIITALVLLSAAITCNAADMVLPIKGVADGDTIRTSLKLPCPLCAASVRIRGIDTPESNYLAKCEKERVLGLKAKEFLTSLAIANETMLARNVKWDKYGGRIDAEVEIAGINVGQEMIRRGFAAPYTGIGPKPNWCA